MRTRHACSGSAACFSTGRICVMRVFQSSMSGEADTRVGRELPRSFLPRKSSHCQRDGTSGKRLPCGRVESVSTKDSQPFSLGQGTRGVLVVHGFAGSPFAMRLLGEALAARGFAVDGVKLAGHAGTTRELARTTWRDWYQSAAEALDRLRDRVGGKRVAVVGLSMGGLLALELARLRGDALAAICVMSAPLWLPPQAEKFSRVMARLPLVRSLALPKLAGSDIRDPEMKRR